MSDAPEGQPYARVYLDRSKPLSDSRALRVRVAQFLNELDRDTYKGIAPYLLREQGVEIPYQHGYLVGQFLKSADIDTFLSSITHLTKFLAAFGWSKSFVDFVRRALAEENVAYRIDNKGGIHPLFDAEFDAMAGATRLALGKKFSDSAKAFDQSIEALSETPSRRKDALRHAFDAVEIMVKHLYGVERLTRSVVLQKVRPDMVARVDGDEIMESTIKHLSESLGDWVEAAHDYRHGQAEGQRQEPSLDTAIAMVSVAGTFARWLASQHST